jgi:hypothetical protein
MVGAYDHPLQARRGLAVRLASARGAVSAVYMHRACHKQIHALFTETELAKNYSSLNSLYAHPEIARFINWVKHKPSEFNPPTRRSRSKGVF